jgi:hypothetical protein
VVKHVTLDVWRSCTGWRYPADDDSYMIKEEPVVVSSSGHATFVADVNCYYTLTTRTGVTKPVLPTTRAQDPRPAFFPLPFSEDFEGVTVGGEVSNSSAHFRFTCKLTSRKSDLERYKEY